MDGWASQRELNFIVSVSLSMFVSALCTVNLLSSLVCV